MRYGFWVIYAKLFFDEYEVVDDEVSNPFELIRLETAFVFIPIEEVLADGLTKLFNVIQKYLLD